MSYEQAVKHSKNHRKDRFVQQCSGYAGNGDCAPLSDDARRKCEIDSFSKLKEIPEESYPIYIVNSGGAIGTKQQKETCLQQRLKHLTSLSILGRIWLGYKRYRLSFENFVKIHGIY